MAKKKGWPKGKPRGPMSEEGKTRLRVMAVRSNHRRRNQGAAMAAGRDLPGAGQTYKDWRPERGAAMDITPAAWRAAKDHVGDFEYVNDGLDDVLLRALRDRVVYASSVCCHHEPAFQELTVTAIATVEREFRKKKLDPAPVAKGLLAPFKVKEPAAVVTKPIALAMPGRKLTDLVKVAKATGHREGRSLADVVSEMFES